MELRGRVTGLGSAGEEGAVAGSGVGCDTARDSVEAAGWGGSTSVPFDG